MNSCRSKNRKPIEERLILLRRFPKEVVELLSREELNIFIYEEELPLSLGEKLKDFLVD
ncbi:MAG: hypothetical protein JW882_19510 [Deltaproteobacteria bacterium]|nr:hypothetical protein [Deltaproteobacteria bacterium]